MSIPTLQTIADLAGMSRSTVSMALRNRPNLSPATRERIQKIAEEIGYRPNPLISTLMTHLRSSRPISEQGTLAFLTNFPARHGWRHYRTYERFFEGAVERARQNGYRLDEFWLKEPGMSSLRMKNILDARGIQGVVIAPLLGRGGHLSLDLSGLASVTYGISMKRPSLHRVDNHQVESVRTALRELKHRGYRRPGLAIVKQDDQHVNHNWTMAYTEYQLRERSYLLVPIHDPKVANKEALLTWIQQHRVDVLLCVNPEFLELLQGSMKIPHEIGVAILDLNDLDRKRGIAGIDGRPELSGASAIDVLIGQIHRNERGVPTAPKLVLMEGIWIDGDTVAKHRGDDSAEWSHTTAIPKFSKFG